MNKDKNIIFGVRAIIEALDAGKEIEKALLKRGSASDNFRELLQKLREHNATIQFVPLEKLNSVTRKNHQGAVAFLSEISYSELSMIIPGVYEAGEVPLVLVLDQVSDVRNFGAIARTAECAGVHAIVIPRRGTAMINAEAIKTSAGALLKIPVCRYDSLLEAVRFLKESGLQLVASSEKAADSAFRTKMDGPLAIIMGSEDRGITADLLSKADQIVSIPMKGTINSLNVSVAAGILLFEVARQRMEIIQEEAAG